MRYAIHGLNRRRNSPQMRDYAHAKHRATATAIVCGHPVFLYRDGAPYQVIDADGNATADPAPVGDGDAYTVHDPRGRALTIFPHCYDTATELAKSWAMFHQHNVVLHCAGKPVARVFIDGHIEAIGQEDSSC